MKISKDQRRVLAEFCGNFAVVWLAVGVVPSFLTGKITIEVIRPAVLSVVLAVILLTVMLFLVKGGKK